MLPGYSAAPRSGADFGGLGRYADRLRAAALYRLTASSEAAYAAVGSIGEAAGVPAGETRDCLEKDLAEFVLEADGPEGGFRFKGMYMNLLPILSLLNFR